VSLLRAYQAGNREPQKKKTMETKKLVVVPEEEMILWVGMRATSMSGEFS